MKKFYDKLIHELIRYIHLRTPKDPNDEVFDFITPDKIDVNEKILIELSPFRDMDSAYYNIGPGAGTDVVFYEKIKPCYVRIHGWIMITEFGSILYPTPESRYVGHIGKRTLIPAIFPQCRTDIGFLLYMHETFDKLGGRMKDIESFYNHLTLLNDGLI